MQNPIIHPTAIVDPGAKIAKGVIINPYCVIGGNVTLNEGVKLESHVCISGHTIIGENTHIFPFVSIGHIPQDLKYSGEQSKVIIGKNNVIREYVTIHPGTQHGNMQTVVGDNCLLMIGSHIAHDCVIGNNVILANNATLAGHVVVGDYAILGGLSAVHQFVRIGAHSIVGGLSAVVDDIIPYGSATGERATLKGLNMVGMKRRNFSYNEVHGVRNAIKKLFFDEQGTLASRVAEVAKEYQDIKSVMDIVEFLQTTTTRSICLPDKNLKNEI